MNRLISIIVGIVAVVSASAYDFEYTYKGKTLKYTVIDQYDRTCITTSGSETNGAFVSGNVVSGDLTIPEYAIDRTSGSGIQYKVIGVGAYSFFDCTSLNSVILPSSVLYMENNAFCNCTRLNSITLPESLLYIDSETFLGCSKLVEISIPESVTSIEYGAFSGCKALRSVNIPESVFYIGAKAFSDCISIEAINLPASVTSIGVFAFQNCKSLITLEIPESITKINGGCFEFCSKLQSVHIPESVTIIDNLAFKDCESLKTVIIPESVTTIGGYVFDGCSNLTTVTMPSHISSFGDISGQVFVNCPKLRAIYYDTSNPFECDVNNFSSETYTLATLYVPSSSVAEFQHIQPWSNFNLIVAYNFSGIKDIIEDIDISQSYEIFSLDGIKVINSIDNLKDGIYVIRQGNNVKKIAIK